MAEFCKQCSIGLFGIDYRDFAGLCGEGEHVLALCEGCGIIHVDADGNCLTGECAGFHRHVYTSTPDDAVVSDVKENANGP